MDVPIDQKIIQKWLTDIWTSTDDTSCEKAMKELAIAPLKKATECQPKYNDTVISETEVKPSCEPVNKEPVTDATVDLLRESFQEKDIIQNEKRSLRQHKNTLEASRVDSSGISFRSKHDNKLLSPRIDRASLNNENMTGPTYITPTPPGKSTALNKMWEEENEKVMRTNLKIGPFSSKAMNKIVTRDCDFCRGKDHPLQKCSRYIPVRRVFPTTQIMKNQGRKYCFLCQEIDDHYAPTCDFFVWVSRPSHEQIFTPQPAHSA